MRKILVAVAFCFTLFIFYNIYSLFQAIKKEERLKMELWAMAQNKILESQEIESFSIEIIEKLGVVPMILIDEEENIIDYRNIDFDKKDSWEIKKVLKKLKKENIPIKIKYNNVINYLYYSDSDTLKKIQIYPVAILLIISLFVLISSFFLRAAQISEQNKLWAGIAKETAHQIGTPLSSLLGWVAVLKSKGQSSLLFDIEKDLMQLKNIADRFSKIGSKAQLVSKNIVRVIKNITSYMKKRSSKRINFIICSELKGIEVFLSPLIFSWAIENLIKNAIDAMKGAGKIKITIVDKKDKVIVFITDTGSGIEKKYWKKIFVPGFSTKRKGWGMGLSLTKRIVENYHKGKIGIKKSEIGKGTTFYIKLKKNVIIF